MSVQVNFNVAGVYLNTFAVNNVAIDKLPQSGFYFEVNYREQLHAAENIIGIISLVNVYSDQSKSVRIGAIETRCDYIVQNFKDVLQEGQVPEQFLAGLLNLSLATTRGMLVAKSSGTMLGSFLLPMLDPIAMVQNTRRNKTTYDTLAAAGNQAELGNFAKAVEIYSEILRQEPANVDALFNRGAVYANTGEHLKAIEDFTGCLAIAPQAGELYYHRGNSYRASGQEEKALEDYNKSIELNPDLFQAYINRGLIHKYFNDVPAAIADFQKSLSINGEIAIAYAALAEIYADENKDQLFYQHFDAALKYGFPLEAMYPDIIEKYRDQEEFQTIAKKYQS